jgi:hypothetical protein
MRKCALSLRVAIQAMILLAASVVALAAGLGGHNLDQPASVAQAQTPDQDQKPKTRHRVPFATEAEPAVGTPQPDVAPFFGNLSVVPVPTNNFVLLRRENDCSLTLLNYTIVISGQGTSVVLNSQTPHYERTIHANAFLTTTPDVFPKGCVDSIIGTTSVNVVFMGSGASGEREVAAKGATTVFGINVKSDGTPGPFNVLTPDIAPASVTSGDMNKDGNPDIVSINTDGINSSVSVFLGNADGTYQAAKNLDLPNVVAQFGAVDDLNGDGNLDVIVNTGNSTFTVFLGKGDGTFNAPVTVSTGASTVFFADSFITADVNGDKKKDIVTSEGLVLLGQGDGMTFTAVAQKAFPATTGGSDQGLGIVAADFNADGKLDLATCDGRAIRIYPGIGDGTFKTGQAYSTIGNRGFIFPTDLDGDGNLDLVSGFVGNGMYSGDDFLENYTYALMGNGDGTFQGAPVLGVVYNGTNLADLNGDGRPDLVGLVGPTLNTFQTYLTGTNGVPVAGPTLAVPVNVAIDSWALGDVTGDKVQDLVFFSAAPQAQSYYVAVGNGDGTFQTPTATPLPSLVPSGIDINPMLTGMQLADIDHDGNLDLIYSFSDQDEASKTFTQGFAVQLGNGKGSFGLPIITTYYSSLNGPTIFFTNTLNAVVDVTGDNFPDVFIVAPMTIVGGEQQIEALSYVGKGDGTFKAPNTLTLAPNILTKLTTTGSPLTFADINHDGKMDVLASGSDTTGSVPTLAIAFGNGDGTFQAPTLLTFEGFGFTSATAVADFDGDGKPDIFLNQATEGVGPGILPGNGDGTFQTISNADGTVSPPEQVALAIGLGAVAVDLKNDGKQDVIAGGTVLLNKFGQTPPTMAETSTSLTAAPNPATAGATVTLTATVTSSTAGTITGTVTFLDGGTSIGTGTVGAGGVATLMTSALAAGSHSITASYGGDANYAGSVTPAPVTLVINGAGKASTTTAVASSLNPSTTGASVTFTATVTSATAGTITGTVTFFDNGGQIGTGTLSGGKAVFMTSTLSAGTHPITASYGGDTNYAASAVSPVVSQVVNAAGLIATTTALTGPTTGTPGANLTYTATVTPASGTKVPTGQANFFDGATMLGNGSLNGSGVATFSTATLAAGAHSITAQYGGDNNFSGSTSNAVATTIAAPAGNFTLSVAPSSVIVTRSTPGMATVTVTPTNGFNQAVQFSCMNVPEGIDCEFEPHSVTPNGGPATAMLAVTEEQENEGARGRKAGRGIGNWWPGGNHGGSGVPIKLPFAFALGVELLALAGLWRKKQITRGHGGWGTAFAVVLLLAVATFAGGCSGSPGHSTGTAITVVGTGPGGATATATLNVTIQK